MIDYAIVSFIDILGFKTIVEKFKDNISFIKEFEGILQASSVGFKEGFKLRGLIGDEFKDEDLKLFTEKIIDVISIRFISDAILFTLPLSKIKFTYSEFTEKEVTSHCLKLYFEFMATFCTFLIGKTGLVLRGGISIGNHYENEIDIGGSSLFIFSEAYNNAYKLEGKANKARILIDNKLWFYLKELEYNYMDKYFYEDAGIDERCFDYYSWFVHDETSKKVLTNIREGITYNFKNNIKNPEALDKLKYFVEYHNKKVSKKNLNFEQLKIDIIDL